MFFKKWIFLFLGTLLFNIFSPIQEKINNKIAADTVIKEIFDKPYSFTPEFLVKPKNQKLIASVFELLLTKYTDKIIVDPAPPIFGHYNKGYNNSLLSSWIIHSLINVCAIHPDITESLILSCMRKTLESHEVEKVNEELKQSSLIDLLSQGKPTTWPEIYTLLLAIKRESNLTPTETHWILYLKTIEESGYCTRLQQNPAFKQFVKNLVAKEKEIIAQDHISFVHATQEKTAFLMDMYTQGWFVKNNKKLDPNYLFMRFDNCNRSPQKRKLKMLLYLFMRKKIIDSKGGLDYSNQYAINPTESILLKLAHMDQSVSFDQLWGYLNKQSIHTLKQTFDSLNDDEFINCVNEKMRKHIVFLNAPFFANTPYDYDCTAFFFWSNVNWTPPTLDLNKVNKKLGLSSHFDRYQNEFKELEALHEKIADDKGVVIQFDCTPHAARKSIYLAKAYGYKNALTTINNQSITDVKEISDLLRSNILKLQDLDIFQYSYIASNQGPGKGIKMYRHYYGDPTLVQEYYQKRDVLFAQIRADYQKDHGIAVAA